MRKAKGRGLLVLPVKGVDPGGGIVLWMEQLMEIDPAEFRVDRAVMGDLGKVWGVVCAAIQSMTERGILQWDEVYPTREDFANDISVGSLFVLNGNQTVVGCVALDTVQPPEYQAINWMGREPALVVHRLTIHPQFQGRGLAGRLVAFAETYAQQEGFSSIRLDAFTKHPAACKLYERFGYHNLGVVELRKGPFYCFEKMIGAGQASDLSTDRK